VFAAQMGRTARQRSHFILSQDQKVVSDIWTTRQRRGVTWPLMRIIILPGAVPGLTRWTSFSSRERTCRTCVKIRRFSQYSPQYERQIAILGVFRHRELPGPLGPKAGQGLAWLWVLPTWGYVYRWVQAVPAAWHPDRDHVAAERTPQEPPVCGPWCICSTISPPPTCVSKN
jgi:hypothetical protein